MKATRLVWLLAITVLVAACGTTSSPGSGDTSNPEDISPPDVEPETVADFLGWGDFDETQWRNDETRIQELIRQCMTEHGFEYIPAQEPVRGFTVAVDEEEWIREHGFGITMYANDDDLAFGDGWEDPNWRIVEAMSDSERDAYYAALHGSREEWDETSTTHIDPDTGEEIRTFEGWGFGCEGEATEKVRGDMNQSNDLWEELQPHLEAMWHRVEADPRIVELDEGWSACMTEAGFEFDSRQDMFEWVYTDLQQRFDAMVDNIWNDPFEGWSQSELQAFFEEHTDDEIEALLRAADEASLAEIDEEALAVIQQEEIDLAVANLECSAGLDEVFEDVAREYEKEFLAQNRRLLERIRETQEG